MGRSPTFTTLRSQAGERLAFSKGGRASRTGWSTSLTTTTPQERKAAMFAAADAYDEPEPADPGTAAGARTGGRRGDPLERPAWLRTGTPSPL